jgi:hypothetical protein
MDIIEQKLSEEKQATLAAIVDSSDDAESGIGKGSVFHFSIPAGLSNNNH